MGKILIITGIVIVVTGILIHFYPGNGLPRLPGDIYIKRENYSFYLPLGWSVLISALLSLVFWLFSK
jgi:hypothetical protein